MRAHLRPRRARRDFWSNVWSSILIGVTVLALLIAIFPTATSVNPGKPISNGAQPVNQGGNTGPGGGQTGLEVNGQAGPLLLPGTYVDIQCPDGWLNFTAGASIHCHDTTLDNDLCDSSQCTFTIQGKMDKGYSFAGWGTSGQAAVSSATQNPTTFYVYTPNMGNHYTGGLTLCSWNQSNCVNGGGGCTAASMSQPTAQNTSGYQQDWVNWSFVGTLPITPSFSWWVGNGPNLAIPLIGKTGSSASINLNALKAGTMYNYEAGVSNGCGGESLDGYFTTPAAPLSELVGWISTLVQDPYQLDQIGAPVAGATIDSIVANCTNTGGSRVRVPFPTTVEGVPQPAATTNSVGHFTIQFPLDYWTAGYVYYRLWPGGGCENAMDPMLNVSNPNLKINATGAAGSWNATIFHNMTFSGTNDYIQFGLPANQQTYTIPGIAFVHTADASCGVTIATTTNQSIVSYNGGNGFTDDTSWTSEVIANPVSNGESVVDFHEYTTGYVNETTSANYSVAYAYGNVFDPSENAVTVVDPNGSPPPGETWPIPGYPGYYVDTVGSGGAILNWYNGGSYTSTAGLDLSISLTGGWKGFSFGPSVRLVYTTTTGKSSSTEISCSLSDIGEPLGDNAQFYYYVDGTQSSNQEAINVHVWFDDYCVPNLSTCN
jgi:hypothetical protein